MKLILSLLVITAINTFGMGLIKPKPPEYKWNPQIAVSGLTYSWETSDYKSELKEIVKTAKEAGISYEKIGVTIEVLATYNVGGKDKWKESLHDNYSKVPALVEEIANNGMFVNLVMYNSNTSGKAYKWSNESSAFYADAKAYILSEANALLDKLDSKKLSKYVIFNMMAEDDNSTPASIRDAMRALGRSRIDREHLMNDSKPAANTRWVDKHPQKLSSTPKAGVNDIITSDSWGIINDLFSKDSTGFPVVPKIEACKQYISKVGSQGIVAFYNVDEKSNFKQNKNAWKEILKGWQ